MSISAEEAIRYSRQMLLSGWGDEGQEKVRSSKVFVAGCGGLGSSVLFYLVAAGIGRINVADGDKVELSNLNRQILHATGSIGISKTSSATDTLKRLNPYVELNAFDDLLEDDNIDEFADGCDVVVDCLDNFQARYVLNRYCVDKGLPLVFGSVSELSGYMGFLKSPDTPCLRCIFKEAPPAQAEFPVLGAVPGVIGSLQAVEVLKYISGCAENLINKMLVFEGSDMRFRSLNINKDDRCPDCADKC